MANAEAIMAGIDYGLSVTGKAVDTAGGIAGLIYGKQDRDYQKYLNNLAQQNWREQMDFAKAQAQAQQDQFEANRIGNLTKEYTEAGLNPLLAAGMGQSTASVVGTGGLPQMKGTEGVTRNMQAAFEEMAQIGKQNSLSQIRKTNAEAALAEAQKDDMEATRNNRIDNLSSETGLNNAKAEEVIAQANELKTRANLNEELQKLYSAETTLTEKKTALTQLETKLKQVDYYQNNELRTEILETQIDKMKKEIEHMDTQDAATNERLVQGWFDRTIGKLMGLVKTK